MKIHMLKYFLVSIAMVGVATVAIAAETIKIAVIDAIDNPSEDQNLKSWRAITDRANAKGGVLDGIKFEVVPFDSGNDVQQSLAMLNQAIDQHIAYVASTNSRVVLALADAIAKHNSAHPDRRALLLNFGAKAPVLTEDQCNFWHFRFSPHTNMDMNFLTNHIAGQKDIHKVYLVNQDYAYGQSVRKAAKEMLAQKRPDLKIVGDELVPLLKTKDFSPIVNKIRDSGADTVITGNWGDDLNLLLKASGPDLKVRYYTTIADVPGTAAAISASKAKSVIGVFDWYANVESNPYADYNAEFRTKYNAVGNFDFIKAIRVVEMLGQAINKAQSAEPLKVAHALEGMRYNGASGEAWMRAEDHQLIAPIYLASFEKAGQRGVKFDEENTGYGWKTEAKIEAKEVVPPINCKMERPR